MSSITTDFRGPAVVRPSALRAADGVIAGYIHSLARAAAKSAAGAAARPQSTQRASRPYACGANRSNALATRRRRPLMRAAAAV